MMAIVTYRLLIISLINLWIANSHVSAQVTGEFHLITYLAVLYLHH